MDERDYFTSAKPIPWLVFIELLRKVSSVSSILMCLRPLPEIFEGLSPAAFEAIHKELSFYQKSFEETISRKIFSLEGYDDDRVAASLHAFLGNSEYRPSQETIEEYQSFQVENVVRELIIPPRVVELPPHDELVSKDDLIKLVDSLFHAMKVDKIIEIDQELNDIFGIQISNLKPSDVAKIDFGKISELLNGYSSNQLHVLQRLHDLDADESLASIRPLPPLTNLVCYLSQNDIHASYLHKIEKILKKRSKSTDEEFDDDDDDEGDQESELHFIPTFLKVQMLTENAQSIVEQYERGEDEQAMLERALRECDAAIALDGRHGPAYATRSHVYSFLSELGDEDEFFIHAARDALAAFHLSGAADPTLAVLAEEAARKSVKNKAKSIFNSRLMGAEAMERPLNLPRPWLIHSYFIGYEPLTEALDLSSVPQEGEGFRVLKILVDMFDTYMKNEVRSGELEGVSAEPGEAPDLSSLVLIDQGRAQTIRLSPPNTWVDEENPVKEALRLLSEPEIVAITGAEFLPSGSLLPSIQSVDDTVDRGLRARLLSVTGSVAYLCGDSSGAVNCFQSAADIDPSFFDATLKLGSLLVDMDESPRAKRLFFDLSKKLSDNPYLYLHWAELCIHDNDFTEALEHIRTAALLAKNSASDHLHANILCLQVSLSCLGMDWMVLCEFYRESRPLD